MKTSAVPVETPVIEAPAGVFESPHDVWPAFVAGLLVDGLVDFPLLTPRLVGTFTLVLALADASGHLYRGEQVHALRRLLPGGKPRTAAGKGGERL